MYVNIRQVYAVTIRAEMDAERQRLADQSLRAHYQRRDGLVDRKRNSVAEGQRRIRPGHGLGSAAEQGVELDHVRFHL